MSAPQSLNLSGLTQRVQACLKQCEPVVSAHDPVVAAVSGGGDSIALLLALSAIQRGAGRPVHVVTVDHGLRASAGPEIALVARLCDRLRLPHHVVRWTPPDGPVGQAAARDARYRLISDVAHTVGARAILTGHNEDDQAETVLMRAAKGSAIVGLAGMRPVAPVPVWPEGRGLLLVRPFLSIGRAKLREILNALGMTWAEDPSNANPRFERVRVRSLIEAYPGMRTHAISLLTPAVRLRRRQDEAVAHLLDHTVVERGGVISIPRPVLTGVPVSVRHRAVRSFICMASGHDRPARLEGLRPFVERLAQAEAQPSTLNGSLGWSDDETVHICRDSGCTAGPSPLRPGERVIWDGRAMLAATIPGLTVARLEPARPLAPNLRETVRTLPNAARASQVGLFDADGQVMGLPLLSPVRDVETADLVAQRLEFERNWMRLLMKM